ncbi:MAG: PilZ domain-containing protein, partial [Deltaproteobacteria bacterium]|nr:PilZ domain-containing protein [Deltaproteobacteria bacterium]
MERRREPRIKRRLTCEFFHGTTSHRGIILDLGPAGIFIRTNAVLSPGTEIDVHLAASVAAPAMTLRGCVVRRRAVPATLTTLIQPGIGVRLLDMPREFGLLTGDCELDEAIQTDYDFTQASNSDQSQGASSPPVKFDSKAGGGER